MMKDLDPINPQGVSSRVALRHLVVQRLLKAIIQGELAPGSRLIANKLAVRLGVSATPIREALVELEQSGIVQLLHHRGALVKPFGGKELRDFYHVRALLEGEAMRLSCGRVDHEMLIALHADLERLAGENGDGHEKWVKEYLTLDQRIHRLAVEHCDNNRLSAEIARYYVFNETMRDLLGFNRAYHHESIVPLIDLLAAMQEQRSEACSAAMTRHIGIVARVVEAVMFDG